MLHLLLSITITQSPIQYYYDNIISVGAVVDQCERITNIVPACACKDSIKEPTSTLFITWFCFYFFTAVGFIHQFFWETRRGRGGDDSSISFSKERRQRNVHHASLSRGSLRLLHPKYPTLLASFTASTPSAVGFVLGQHRERRVLSAAGFVYPGPQLVLTWVGLKLLFYTAGLSVS